jgi:LPS export ABC transporter protein LptC
MMNKNFTQYFILILASCCVLLSCKDSFQKVNGKIDKSVLDTEKADSVTLFYSNNGFLKAKLQAKTFIHEMENTQPYVEMKDGLRITFYDANQQVTSTLISKRGRYFEKNNNVLLRDSVVVTNAKKDMLQTQELIWNEASQKFFTEKHVTITTATQIIDGDGMEANQDFTYYKILNPTGIISVNSSKVPMQ